VEQVPLTDVDPGVAGRMSARDLDDVRVLSPVVPATGYAAVGVTWAPGTVVGDRDLFVRTQTDGAWSRWQPMSAGDQHAATIGSAEAQQALSGTDPVIVGHVDAVQVKMTAGVQRLPAALTLSVIDPGEPTTAQRVAERIDSPAYPHKSGKGSVTPRPGIYSRAQWGADESMRSGFAGYGKIRAGFVHHTVNANDYSPADVPAILRAIYAYHTQSQGWSDVGYNFLVDRFGRIWEGRWGGIERAVIGAHTYGYNEESFAMSAIGNFEVARPPRAMRRAYCRLFAWKLSRNGIDAGSSTRINGRVLRSISGHGDVGSTACPGAHLDERLRLIRRRATRRQQAWSGRGT